MAFLPLDDPAARLECPAGHHRQLDERSHPQGSWHLIGLLQASGILIAGCNSGSGLTAPGPPDSICMARKPSLSLTPPTDKLRIQRPRCLLDSSGKRRLAAPGAARRLRVKPRFPPIEVSRLVPAGLLPVSCYVEIAVLARWVRDLSAGILERSSKRGPIAGYGGSLGPDFPRRLPWP